MKVLFLGDTHANSSFLRRAFSVAALENVEAIIQVGDFGYWPRLKMGSRFLAEATYLVNAQSLPIYFVDGNHEDHLALPHNEAKSQTELADGVIWLPRGSVTHFGDSYVLAVGGAVSVDSHFRTPGFDWFYNETASYVQRQRTLEATGVDVIVAHDIPEGVDLDLTYPVTETVNIACKEYRAYCRDLLDHHSPRLWVGGHYHQRRSQLINTTQVEVLGHDALPMEQTYLVTDL